MTMHIDEALLASVVEEYGYESKTDAVDGALREMNRRAKLRRFMSEGLGLTEEELKDSVLPDYDPMSLRIADSGPDRPHGSANTR